MFENDDTESFVDFHEFIFITFILLERDYLKTLCIHSFEQVITRETYFIC